MDAVPYIDPHSARTLIPVRYLADALGVSTHWDANTQQVALVCSTYNIIMTIGFTDLTVNGQTFQMDVAPVIKDARTYLPARYVANALGYSVDWKAANQIVFIWPSGIPEPDYNNTKAQAQRDSQKFSIPGYAIPSGTQVTVSDSDTNPQLGTGTDIEVVLHMIGFTEPIGQQVSDLQNILSQHLDQDTMLQIMTVVNQKITAGANSPNVEKYFKLDGKSILIEADGGEIYVSVGNF